MMNRKMFVIFVKVASLIIAIMAGGIMQHSILRPDLEYVYIGAAISMWCACSFGIYNTIVRTVLILFGFYRR